MVKRFTTLSGKKGLMVTKKDGRDYSIIAVDDSKDLIDCVLSHLNSSFKMIVTDLVSGKEVTVDGKTYPDWDDRKELADYVHGFIVGIYEGEQGEINGVIDERIQATIKSYIEIYDYNTVDSGVAELKR